MNTTPDEALLALWLDDELHGEELAKVEAWALTQPDQLAMREEVRAFRGMMSTAIPAEVEPPYPDFFNSRIEKSIRELAVKAEPVTAPVRKVSIWRSWLFPATAFAGMALAFWVGTKSHTSPASGPTIAKADEPIASPVYYTPEQGVNAEWVKHNGASTVIVLQGVNAIPDSLDFSETVSYQNPEGGPASNTAATSSPVIPASR